MQDNLDLHVSGKITDSQRRVLMTTWCGNAWSQTDQGMVKKSFQEMQNKCSIIWLRKWASTHRKNIRLCNAKYLLRLWSGNGSETDDQSNDDYRLESELEGDLETDNELQDETESDNELQDESESD